MHLTADANLGDFSPRLRSIETARPGA